MGPELRTRRLLMRRWRAADIEPLAALNSDPRVMRHFPSTLDRAESAVLLRTMEEIFVDRGYGLWALELTDDATVVGFAGLNPIGTEMPFGPAVEIGWRLAATHWGRGLATEAATEAAVFAFRERSLDELVSFTSEGNRRSRAVMERLGMTRKPDEDFQHPRIEAGHPLRPHVLYRMSAASFRDRGGSRC